MRPQAGTDIQHDAIEPSSTHPGIREFFFRCSRHSKNFAGTVCVIDIAVTLMLINALIVYSKTYECSTLDTIDDSLDDSVTRVPSWEQSASCQTYQYDLKANSHEGILPKAIRHCEGARGEVCTAIVVDRSRRKRGPTSWRVVQDATE